MPRNACTECRIRKVKCNNVGSTGKCNRCQSQNRPCSFVQPAYATNSSTGDYHRKLPSVTPPVPEPISPNPVPELGESEGNLALTSNSWGLDVGYGTPAELLREGELTHTLLLLYFTNFNDIHFMFDQTIFMRQYALGAVPKMVIYAMMALGIRYSYAPFKDPHLRSHWGEPLYHQARQLLKEEFDHPSLATVQMYVLLSTYHLTFGGSRKSWIYLNFAWSLVIALQLDQEPSDPDPVHAELSRRLIATIALMSNTFPSSPNNRSRAALVGQLPHVCSDEELDMIKTRSYVHFSAITMPNITQEILSLSEIYHQVRQKLETQDTPQLDEWEQTLSERERTMHHHLVYNPENIALHREKCRLRPFMYMHLLHHQIWQLVLFHSLEWGADGKPTASVGNQDALDIYEHACRIAETMQDFWTLISMDMHNPCIGQILKTAQIVLTHRILSSTDIQSVQMAQANILILRNCLIRMKDHCRLYNWVFNQSEWFLHVYSQDDLEIEDESRREILINQLLGLGTTYERLDYLTAGRQPGTESLANSESFLHHREQQTPMILLPDYITKRFCS